jgi:hypothetical protein
MFQKPHLSSNGAAFGPVVHENAKNLGHKARHVRFEFTTEGEVQVFDEQDDSSLDRTVQRPELLRRGTKDERNESTRIV